MAKVSAVQVSNDVAVSTQQIAELQLGKPASLAGSVSRRGNANFALLGCAVRELQDAGIGVTTMKATRSAEPCEEGALLGRNLGMVFAESFFAAWCDRHTSIIACPAWVVGSAGHVKCYACEYGL